MVSSARSRRVEKSPHLRLCEGAYRGLCGTLTSLGQAARGGFCQFPFADRIQPADAGSRPPTGALCWSSRASTRGRRSTAAAIARWCAPRVLLPAFFNASCRVKACDCRSFGRPAALPSGKSLNRKRGTPQYSTMSFAHPMIRVAMPFSSRCRAARLTVWWHTGQLATRMAASTPSARQRARSSGQSLSRVVRWLRFVGMP
jgi:hypothetical protein